MSCYYIRFHFLKLVMVRLLVLLDGSLQQQTITMSASVHDLRVPEQGGGGVGEINAPQANPCRRSHL